MTRSRTWTLGTAVAVLAIFAIGWFLVISPKKSNAATLRADAAATAIQNQGVEAKIRQLKLQQKALPAQQAQIAAIQQQMPSTPQLPSLLRQINNAADDANVDLSGIAPATPAPVPADTGVSFIPVVVTASGDFTHLKQFLFALEENKRAVLVTGFSIGKADQVATAGSTQSLDPNALAITIQTRVFMTAPAPATVNAPVTGSGTASGTGTTGSTGTPGTTGTTPNGSSAGTTSGVKSAVTPTTAASTPATAGN